MSENDLSIQINGVVGIGIATRTVVVGRPAVEARVAGVLRGELQVLPWPTGEVRNISRASWISIGAAGHRGWCLQCRIDRAARVEITESARVFIAEVVFGICQDGIQMIRAKSASQQIRVFVDKRTPE
jgi:hypothetical protein